MNAIDKNLKLFLVVLGGRLNLSHIELHDVRWVIGTKIEDTFPQLRKEWYGNPKGLHIDSFMEVRFIDGYKISLDRKIRRKKIEAENYILEKVENKKRLWFVNNGGYNPMQLYELHEFDLIVAESALEAKRIAKQKLLKNTQT